MISLFPPSNKFQMPWFSLPDSAFLFHLETEDAAETHAWTYCPLRLNISSPKEVDTCILVD